VGFEKGGRVATCVEVAVDVSGTRSVTKIVTAYDCRRVVNRDAVLNQIEGATIMALGGTLFERVDPERAARGFRLGDYRVPRFSDVPEIEVIIVDRREEPSAGAGETPMNAVAPAIANAIAAVTGERVRSLPLFR
jgi:isoquinoline 1-oxidoreductase